MVHAHSKQPSTPLRLPPLPSAQYMAVVFGILTCPALIATIIFLCGSWYDNQASLEKSTIGNYGLVSTGNGTSSLGAMLLADPAVTATVKDISATSFSSIKGEHISLFGVLGPGGRTRPI